MIQTVHSGNLLLDKSNINKQRCYLYTEATDPSELQKEVAFEKYGDADDLERIAFCYQNADNWEKAFSYYKRAAEKNHPWAQYRIAFCYRWGNGVEKNGEATFDYFKKAAMQNHTWSQV